MPKQLSKAELAAELAKIEMLSPKQARERSDALLKNMLAKPPDPFTPKPSKKTKPAK
jgi:hypothetical protein